MIKIEHVEVFNFEGAIRGMRNPLNSHDKSDSEWKFTGYTSKGERGTHEYIIGEADLALMRKLVKAGSDHRKFLRQILVSMDITAPLYWWKEFDTYKVGTVANSCSTMHTIHKRDLVLGDFSTDKMLPPALACLSDTISMINTYREIYVYWGRQSNGMKGIFDNDRQKAWYQIIQLLPTSYNQLRTVTLNYEVLLNMYHARKAHKLSEWRELCSVIETLPYFADICLTEEKEKC